MIVTETEKPVTETPPQMQPAPSWEVISGEPSMVLNLRRVIESLGADPRDFFETLCIDNEILRMEMTAKGELIIMTPAGTNTGAKNANLSGQLYIWTKANKTGISFDSNTGFTLKNGAIRSPDAAWALRERWDAVLREEQLRMAHFCPDFVIELRSQSDSLRKLQAKMVDWIENGVRLAWLIDPIKKRVSIYRPGAACEMFTAAELVASLGEETLVADELLMPGFRLDLSEIW